jgi:imidazolonepropionase-like amidohydrolase
MGHKDFPVELARNRGIKICLGTEGIVAAGGTNLFDDLFELKREYPHISAQELFGWVTKNPAAALRASDKLGSIAPAKCADIVGVRFPYESGEDLLERLVMSDPKVAFVMVGGEEVIVDC